MSDLFGKKWSFIFMVLYFKMKNLYLSESEEHKNDS